MSRHKDGADSPAAVVAKWDRGEVVQTVEMGGLGPGYEQAIQVLVIELLRDHGDKPLPAPDAADDWGDDTVHRIDAQCCGFSGAQVGAAKSLAYRLIRDGHSATMDSMRAHDADRLILVSKSWPHVESSEPAGDSVSSPIVVRALEAELRRAAGSCRHALWDCGRLQDDLAAGKERERMDDARALLDAAAADYDAVEDALTLAKRALRATTDNGESAPAGTIDTRGATGSGGVSSAPVGRCAP